MNDDDELMLNFAPTAASGNQEATKSKRKTIQSLIADNGIKGSWKQKRAMAKKMGRRSNNNNNSSSLHPPPTADVHNHKHKTDNKERAPLTKAIRREIEATSKLEKQHRNHDSSATTSSGLLPENRKQIISSIFTSNPEPTEITPSVPEKTTEQEEPVKPTNAPLSTSSFSGLGLHTLLSNHLSSKMQIKAPTSIQKSALPHLMSSDQDTIIQAQTGSGKTLTFLLPLVHRLINASNANGKMKLDRDLGTLAVVLSPTRELARQIYTVLETLLQFPSSTSSSDNSESSERVKHWIVPGLVTGGEKRKSEKARLRKGVTILVSTPGRLLDHLKSTQSFKSSNCRWIILDEADKLLELGFEAQVKEIIQLLDDKADRKGFDNWPKRQMIMCSATIEGVQKMAEWAMKDPVFIKASDTTSQKKQNGKRDMSSKGEGETKEQDTEQQLSIPQQLKQHYISVPAKLRLITLMYLLKYLQTKNSTGKVIVFFGTCDSVEFHYGAFSGDGIETSKKNETDTKNKDEKFKTDKKKKKLVSPPTSDNMIDLEDDIEDPYNLLTKPSESSSEEEQEHVPTSPPITINNLFHLHGSLSPSSRQKTYSSFLSTPGSILLTTDVASRGLDLQNVDTIIQYDPPTDIKEYVHRVGRTARVGKEGSGILFLLPSEMEYINLLGEKGCKMNDYSMVTGGSGDVLKQLTIQAHSAPKSQQKDWQDIATTTHLQMERYVLGHRQLFDASKKAYFSHLRAYATHSSAQKHIFHIKKLHLGHIAKSFGLRDTPANMSKDTSQVVKSDRTSMVSKNKMESFKEGARLTSVAARGGKGSLNALGVGGKRPMLAVSEFGDGLAGAVAFGTFGDAKKKRRVR